MRWRGYASASTLCTKPVEWTAPSEVVNCVHQYKDCPVCGIHFERETGYFLNSMFFAYTIGFIVLAPTALYLYLRGVSTAWFTAIVSAEVLLLWPWVHRYSHALWMHVDQLLDPRRPEPSDPPPANDL